MSAKEDLDREMEARLREAIERIKLEMSGTTEEDWVRAIRKSKDERNARDIERIVISTT